MGTTLEKEKKGSEQRENENSAEKKTTLALTVTAQTGGGMGGRSLPFRLLRFADRYRDV
jgi:hypothetical protein